MEPIRNIQKFNFDDSLNLNITSVIVEGGTRRLHATWSPELAQDLQAYHGINAEDELTRLLSEQIAREIDADVINRMWNNLQPRLDTFFPHQETIYGPPMDHPRGQLFYLDFIYDSNPRINTPVTYDNEAWSLNGYFESPIGIGMDMKIHKLIPQKRRSRRVVS